LVADASGTNFFIDILPLFTSAIIALGLMFYANFWIGLVALMIVPIYFWLTLSRHKNWEDGDVVYAMVVKKESGHFRYYPVDYRD
jgi:type II secretory pathway component PulF